jgi:hypothetical protein
MELKPYHVTAMNHQWRINIGDVTTCDHLIMIIGVWMEVAI